MFKVEIRKDCKICGGDLPTPRHRTYCSKECRTREYTARYRDWRTDWQRKRKDKDATYAAPDRKKCKICKRWYVQVGSHITQRHGLTAREYREKYNLPVKRGITAPEYRKRKGDKAIHNKTAENLIAGAKFRFKKGDRRTKIKTFYKSTRYKKDDYYE